jgi:outer membrane protein assembly factor BamB
MERALCLDEKTGKVLWTREWEVNYQGIAQTYAIGPRATPTVDGDRVYTLGAMGMLHCLDARTGDVLWKVDYVKDYGTQVPTWGITAAPMVDGERLLCVVSGEKNAKVVAFHKVTGKEIWRALPSNTEPGYSQPILIEQAKQRQLIVWHASGVASLEPATGKLLWEQPFKTNLGLAVATPVRSGSRLLVSSFYNGSLMLSLHGQEPGADVAWKGASASEIDTDGLHSLVSTPAIVGDFVYGICSYGQLRCLNAKTGARVWETLDATQERARWSTGFLVNEHGRFWINTDRGDLVIANLSPEGYREISRTRLIKPTANSGNRRELGAVNWSHPAYANRHIIARNDEEILRASLAAE